MKKFFIIILLLNAFSSIGQYCSIPVDPTTSQQLFRKVVDVLNKLWEESDAAALAQFEKLSVPDAQSSLKDRVEAIIKEKKKTKTAKDRSTTAPPALGRKSRTPTKTPVKEDEEEELVFIDARARDRRSSNTFKKKSHSLAEIGPEEGSSALDEALAEALSASKTRRMTQMGRCFNSVMEEIRVDAIGKVTELSKGKPGVIKLDGSFENLKLGEPYHLTLCYGEAPAGVDAKLNTCEDIGEVLKMKPSALAAYYALHTPKKIKILGVKKWKRFIVAEVGFDKENTPPGSPRALRRTSAVSDDEESDQRDEAQRTPVEDDSLYASGITVAASSPPVAAAAAAAASSSSSSSSDEEEQEIKAPSPRRSPTGKERPSLEEFLFAKPLHIALVKTEGLDDGLVDEIFTRLHKALRKPLGLIKLTIPKCHKV